MANVILAYPNYLDANPAFAPVVVDGGQWEAELPITNIMDRLLVRRARSTNLALTSTQFWVDLGVARDIRVIAMPFLTASRDARVRVRGYNLKDTNSTLRADTGWFDLYPIIYPTGVLYWGHPSLFDGRMTPEEASLFPMPVVRVLPTTIVAQYWFFEIDDTTSDLGYVEVPRVFLSPGWQPRLNFIYGSSQGYEPRTTVNESMGGAEFFDVQAGRRVARFSFDYLSEDEAMVQVVDMQRRLGIDGQFFFISNPDDTFHLHRRAFPARLRSLSPVEYAALGLMGATFEVSEVIA